MKRKLSFFLTIIMILSVMTVGLFNITANAETTIEVASGTCGDNVLGDNLIWTLDDEGTLTISGTGGMKNYTQYGIPWYEFRKQIVCVKIENGVTNIGELAFNGLAQLTNVIIPDSVTSIERGAFYSCLNLQKVSLPDGIIKIGDSAFSYCQKLTNINLPQSIISIEGSAFNSCKALTSITLPANITTVGKYTFQNCDNLKQISIPCSVKFIDSQAFYGCTGLTNVYYCGTSTQWGEISIGSLNTDLQDANLIYCSCGHCWISELCTEAKICSKCGFSDDSNIREHKWQNATCTTPKTCLECNFIEGNAIGHRLEGTTSCKICGIDFGEAAGKEFTITYHLDGGTNSAKNPDIYTCEDGITLREATKVGYDFVGWFLDEAKTESISEIVNRTENLDLYAKFSPKSYTATFNGNGADEYGYKVTLINDKTGEERYVYLHDGDSFSPHEYWKPRAYGYIYAGWTYNSEVLTDTLKINSDIVLVPRWIDNPNNYPVLGDDQSVHIDLYSLSRTQKFYISYDYVGFEYVCMLQKYIGIHGDVEAYSWCTISSDSGFFEQVWYSSSEKNYRGLATKYFSESFRAKFGELYYVTLGTSNSSLLNEVYVGIGASEKRTDIGVIEVCDSFEFNGILNAPTANKTNYNFIGWFDEQGNKITDTWQYLEEQTFIAKWEPTKYTISYELNDGINNSANPASYTIEDTISLQNPSKVGYTFKGWYSDANFTTPVTSISNKAEDITLYAKWEANSYNLALDANAGAFVSRLTFISDGIEIKKCCLYEQDKITAYRPPHKEGYIFAGWYKESTFDTLFEFNGTITNDITLYAKWIKCDSNIINIESIESINVTIQGKTEQLYAFIPVADGAILITSESNNLDLYGILYDANGKVLISADDISNNDFDFSYSYNVKAGELYYIAVKGNTASTKGEATVSIDWTGSCTITGTTYSNKQTSVTYDTEYALPEKPIREGYVFLGWFDENGTKVIDGTWKFATDKTLTARWEEATYHTVIFKDANGTIISTETYYFSEDIIAPEFPTKSSDHIGSYLAKWDNDYTGVCTGDAVYTVMFEIDEYVDYTIVFKNWNGEIISEQTYHYGDAVVTPITPVRIADNTYTYTFNGWDSEVVVCGGNAVYTATYNKTYIDYIVIFKDENGTVFNTNTYHYGDTVTAPESPTKAADNIYTYEFAGWNNEVVDCAGNTTYTATYNATFINYTITFKDENGSVISAGTYHYGENVVVPTDPTKASDNTYTYTFAGWDSDVVACNGNKNYVAIYTPKYIEYTVVFKDYDGTIISTKTYHYGDTVTAPTAPTRETDVVGSYTFMGWDQEVVNCAGNATHTATYDVTYTDYTITFKNWNGDVISTKSYHYGDTVTIPVDPTREADKTYTYTFAGWDKNVTKCEENATYTAQYTTTNVEYTVVFKDENGTVLSTKTYYYGDEVEIPNAPSKVADNTYTYTFAGWDKEVVDCVADATYTATYTPVYIDYTVTFTDYDGSTIKTVTYHYGDTIAAIADPTRASDETYTYAFAGWDKTPGTCTGNMTFKATYTSTHIDYTVIFKNEDGTLLSRNTYHYGDAINVPQTPTKVADNTCTYTFKGWDKEVVDCAGNATYIATYNANYIDYTVIFKNADGTVLSTEKYHYGDDVTAPTAPTKAADNTYTYTFKSWDKEVVTCAGDATYTATYNLTYIDYTVIFKNEDGSVISTKTYHYGDTVKAPETPTKAADNTYTYTFTGWDSAVVACNGDKVYTATFMPVFIEYTVVFKDWNGNVISGNEYHYGQSVTKPSNPTRDADNTYTYAFAGWDKTVTSCTESTVYTATYSSTYIEYEVVFKNYDGTILSTNKYHYGDTVAVLEAPTKPADESYTYGFAGWDSEVTACLGNKIYTATFSSTNVEYTVVFKDWNGNVISSKTYHFGDEVVVPEAPSRNADNTYIYTFKNWGNISTSCNGNKEYTAVYNSEYIEYSVVFKDHNGDTLSSKAYHYGDEVVVPSDPTRVADNTYTYAFAGWDKEIVDCVANATYTATYNSTYIDYTVIFKDEDGTVLSTKTYHYGDAVTAPETPTKATDNTYTYTFKAWDKTVVNCAGNATYTATYNSTYIDYTVIFKNEDGTVLSTNTYHYGDEVTAPETPTKEADDEYTYTFKSWDATVVACAGDATYMATYTATAIEDTNTPGTDTEPNDPDTDVNTPSDNDTSDENEGLSGGAIAGIAVGSTVAVGAGGFSLFWFVIKKKSWAELLAVFKK